VLSPYCRHYAGISLTFRFGQGNIVKPYGVTTVHPAGDDLWTVSSYRLTRELLRRDRRASLRRDGPTQGQVLATDASP
jgi:hypothetical protein